MRKRIKADEKLRSTLNLRSQLLESYHLWRININQTWRSNTDQGACEQVTPPITHKTVEQITD